MAKGKRISLNIMITIPATTPSSGLTPWWLALQQLTEALQAPHDVMLAEHAWTTYCAEVTLRKPQPGDLQNMELLRARIEQMHPGLHQRITATSTDWARHIATRYYNHAIDALDPISYSGAMDWFATANRALDAIEQYERYNPTIAQPFPMRPLAHYLQRLATLEKNHFHDFKDEEFVPEFEKIMVRISRRHINASK